MFLVDNLPVSQLRALLVPELVAEVATEGADQGSMWEATPLEVVDASQEVLGPLVLPGHDS